ncbi:hypothetical protein PN462_00360 [Spirulina sp. CS-785/01]|uniref:hypothetical protein n=1 Tax=Spirulina sp. CS-785/01 TaxID=3021716 RepID=UPI00232C6ED2|nr:hypothetical protein [Spirulina sp. CS-785/01]MDB9311533.1 hypothetical protein [Spirulina sp. CS-785/01]
MKNLLSILVTAASGIMLFGANAIAEPQLSSDDPRFYQPVEPTNEEIFGGIGGGESLVKVDPEDRIYTEANLDSEIETVGGVRCLENQLTQEVRCYNGENYFIAYNQTDEGEIDNSLIPDHTIAGYQIDLSDEMLIQLRTSYLDVDVTAIVEFGTRL